MACLDHHMVVARPPKGANAAVHQGVVADWTLGAPVDEEAVFLIHTYTCGGSGYKGPAHAHTSTVRSPHENSGAGDRKDDGTSRRSASVLSENNTKLRFDPNLINKSRRTRSSPGDIAMPRRNGWKKKVNLPAIVPASVVHNTAVAASRGDSRKHCDNSETRYCSGVVLAALNFIPHCACLYSCIWRMRHFRLLC
ncbi:hypothetical protein IG631_02119 [Alternaria alternata]|nr:hypothetical protein IG631_02119 [Alternaria alternata]